MELMELCTGHFLNYTPAVYKMCAPNMLAVYPQSVNVKFFRRTELPLDIDLNNLSSLSTRISDGSSLMGQHRADQNGSPFHNIEDKRDT